MTRLSTAVLLFVTLLITTTLACRRTPPAAPTTPTSMASRLQSDATRTTTTPPLSPIPLTTTPTITNTATTPPTADANADAWTIVVYINGDNNLEKQALFDINEMEAAGTHPKVNVVVQMDRIEGEATTADDWTTTRRYEIQSDTNPNAIGSTLIADLGELNMGDPDTLADFVSWGITNYPAQQYALVLWDHGTGWLGISFDDSTPNGDGLTLNEMDSALTAALAQTNLDALDIIGFDACLMGQLDVYQKLDNHARYAIGSEALVPLNGWDYAGLLQTLYTDPELDSGAMANLIVSSYNTYYTKTEPDDFVTMAAVDLQMVPLVTTAVDNFATTALRDPALVASSLGDGRSGAEAYGLPYGEDAEYYASIDLWHFASIVAQRSPDPLLITAAEEVMTAVEQAVTTEKHGSGMRNAKGIAMYFPRTAKFLDDTYATETNTPQWHQMLANYYDAGLSTAPLPEVNIVNVLRNVVNVQKPTYLDFEIAGRDIANMYILGGRTEPDGRARVLEYDYLIPEPQHLPDGSELYTWRNGVHEDFYVWNSYGFYLSDGVNGDFVTLWPTDYNSTLYTIQGTYTPTGGQGTPTQANLVFDASTQQLSRVWGYQTEEAHSAPHEIAITPGDTFQIHDVYINEDGSFEYTPNVLLTVPLTDTLAYTQRPLPDGNYFLTLTAENIAGETADASVNLTVNNNSAALQPNYNVYFDPYNGYEFLYPNTWHRPTYSNGQLYTGTFDGSTTATVTLYPELGTTTTADLTQQALTTFGAVGTLYTGTRTLDNNTITADYTAYGYYDTDNVQHTGILLTFAVENVGYVVDIDGLTAAEDVTLTIVDTLLASWNNNPIGYGLQPGQWAPLNLDILTISAPANYHYEVKENGWVQLVSQDISSFVALRVDAPDGSDAPALADKFLALAESLYKDQFTAESAYLFPLSGRGWVRYNFEYTNEANEKMWGFIMATIIDGQQVVAWAEAPATTYNQLERAVFLIAIADLQLLQTSPPPTYTDPFDELGSWGSGNTDMVTGNVHDGAYDLFVRDTNGVYPVTSGQQFGTGIYEITTTQYDGALNSGYGLLLQYEPNTNTFYAFEISSDGFVWIGSCSDNCNGDATPLVAGGWFDPQVINNGLHAVNTLRVIARDTSLTFFINNQRVGHISNLEISEREVGLFIEALGSAGTGVRFDDFSYTPFE